MGSSLWHDERVGLDARISIHSLPTGWSVAGELDASTSPSLSAAFAAISLVVSSLAATRRSLIPVRVVIHSSLVSTMRERSSLVRIFSGV